ncbi:hypothetical protein B5S33_g3964 [[Candida] boidinii]|nr:hypothetical protein B5S33_g3964 [[Candida] boidinii]
MPDSQKDISSPSASVPKQKPTGMSRSNTNDSRSSSITSISMNRANSSSLSSISKPHLVPIAIKPRPIAIAPLPISKSTNSISTSKTKSDLTSESHHHHHHHHHAINNATSNPSITPSKNWVLPPRPKTTRKISTSTSSQSTTVKEKQTRKAKCKKDSNSPESITNSPSPTITTTTKKNEPIKRKPPSTQQLTSTDMDRGMTSTESNASSNANSKINPHALASLVSIPPKTINSQSINHQSSSTPVPSSKKPIKSIPFHINAQIHSNIDLTTNNSLELKIQLQSVTKENDNLKKILVKLNREINNLKLLKIENETERLRKSTLSKESLLKPNANKIKRQSPEAITHNNTKKIPYTRSKSTSHSPAVVGPVPVIKQQKSLSTKGRSQSTSDVLDLPPFPTIDDIEITATSNASLQQTTGLTTTELKKLLGDTKSIDPISISYNMETKRHKSNKMSSRSNSETAIPKISTTDDLSFLDMPSISNNNDMDIDDTKIEDNLYKKNIKPLGGSTAGTVGLNSLIGLGTKTMFNNQDTNNSSGVYMSPKDILLNPTFTNGSKLQKNLHVTNSNSKTKKPWESNKHVKSELEDEALTAVEAVTLSNSNSTAAANDDSFIKDIESLVTAGILSNPSKCKLTTSSSSSAVKNETIPDTIPLDFSATSLLSLNLVGNNNNNGGTSIPSSTGAVASGPTHLIELLDTCAFCSGPAPCTCYENLNDWKTNVSIGAQALNLGISNFDQKNQSQQNHQQQDNQQDNQHQQRSNKSSIEDRKLDDVLFSDFKFDDNDDILMS